MNVAAMEKENTFVIRICTKGSSFHYIFLSHSSKAPFQKFPDFSIFAHISFVIILGNMWSFKCFFLLKVIETQLRLQTSQLFGRGNKSLFARFWDEQMSKAEKVE